MSRTYTFAKKQIRILVALGAAFALSQILAPIAFAATFTGAFVSLSDSRPSQSGVSYTIDVDNISTGTTIRCMQLDFGTNVDGTGDAGLTVGSAVYSGANSDFIPDAQTWTASTTSEVNDTIDITNATGEQPGSATNGTLQVTTITNGSTADNDYFAILRTFTNTNCSTGPTDSGVATFIYTTGQSVSLTVDPSLSFTVAGTSSATACNGSNSTVTTTATTVPFGTVTTGANAIGVQNLAVTTNAGSGYTTYTRYTAAPTSGANTISDVSGATNSSPQNFSAAGTEAFGYTTNDSTLSVTGDGADRFTNPASQYAAFTATNAEVAFSSAAVNNQTTCVAYQVGIGATTEAGTYTNTVIFTTTPIY